mgnify:CR=1 FL=1
MNTTTTESARKPQFFGLLTTPGAVLALLCVLYFILFMDRVSLNTPRPMMMKDLGLTNTQLGIAFSAFSLPYAFFQLVGGWIGDRFGAGPVLVRHHDLRPLGSESEGRGAPDARRGACDGDDVL